MIMTGRGRCVRALRREIIMTKTATRKQPVILPLLCLGALTVFLMLLLNIKHSSVINFLISSLPIIGGGAALIIYSSGSETPYALAASLIFTMLRMVGTALHNIMEISDVLQLTLINLFGVLFSAGVLLVYRVFICRFLNKKSRYLLAIYCVSGAICMLYLILNLFANWVNGAKLWIFIGSFSLQVSEYIRLLYIVLLSLLVNSGQSNRFILVYSTTALVICGIGFLFLSEAGTFVLMSIVTLIVQFIFLKTKTAIIITVLALTVVGTMLWFAVTQHDTAAPQTDAVQETMASENESTESTLPCDDMQTESKQPESGILSRFFSKVYDRLVNADPHQQSTGFTAITNGGLFGIGADEHSITVSAPSSDMVLTSLTQYFGILMTIFCILASGVIQVLVFLAAQDEQRNNTVGFKIGLIASVALSVAMLVTTFSNSGFAPLFGLGFPLICSGGTQASVDFTIAVLVVMVRQTVQQPVSPVHSIKERLSHRKGVCFDED